MLKKKFLLGIGTVLSASMLLAGCGTKEPAAAKVSEPPKESAAPVVEEKDAEPVTLNFLGWKTGKEEGALPDLIKKFESENSGITVEYEAIPTSNNYYDVLKSRLATGEGPDVFMTSSGTDTKLMAEAGYLADLSGEAWVGTVQDNIAKLTSYKDKTYVLPIEASGLGLITNMTVLNKVGVTELPTNWNELLEACEKVKTAGMTPFILGNKTGWSGGVMMGFGVTAEFNDFDNDIYTRIADGKATYTDLYTKSIEKYETLVSKGYTNGKESLGMEFNDAAVAEFAKGNSAFIIAGTWMIQEISDLLKDQEIIFSGYPIKDEDPVIAELNVSTTLAVSADSPNLEAAKKFIDFWSKDENLKVYVDSQTAFTTLKGGTSMEMPQAKAFADTLAANNGSVGPKADDRLTVDSWGILTKEAQLITIGESTAEKACKTLDDAFKQSQTLTGK